MTLLRPKGLRRAGAGNIEVDLSGGPTAVALGEKDVIILVALERRVKMDKVNRFVFDITAEYFQVIAVIQNVLCHIAPVVLFKGESDIMFLSHPNLFHDFC
jgi:hypothetical protein